MVVDGLGCHGLMNWKIFGLPSIFQDVVCLVCCLGFRLPNVGHMATVVQYGLFSTCVVSGSTAFVLTPATIVFVSQLVHFGGGHSRQQR